eukprot:5642013-Amphidinium_carterae.1
MEWSFLILRSAGEQLHRGSHQCWYGCLESASRTAEHSPAPALTAMSRTAPARIPWTMSDVELLEDLPCTSQSNCHALALP